MAGWQLPRAVTPDSYQEQLHPPRSRHACLECKEGQRVYRLQTSACQWPLAGPFHLGGVGQRNFIQSAGRIEWPTELISWPNRVANGTSFNQLADYIKCLFALWSPRTMSLELVRLYQVSPRPVLARTMSLYQVSVGRRVRMPLKQRRTRM